MSNRYGSFDTPIGLLYDILCHMAYVIKRHKIAFYDNLEVWYIPPTRASEGLGKALGKSRGEGKPRPSRARVGGISFFFIKSFLLVLDFPSRGVTGLTVYISDFHTLRGEVWKIHYQTCHTL